MMQVPSRDDLAKSGTLEDLYGQLDKIGIAPGWAKRTPSLWSSPRKNFEPAHWRYEQARGALDAAGRLINTELAERRNLTLTNPAATNSGYGTLRTMVAAYQMIMPGEWARAHRHTPNALRLILDSEPGTYTEVDGIKISMEPGDVLLTPNWSSHGHGNDSRSCAYWLDFLDVPLVQLLEPMFFEPAEEDKTHEAFEKAPPTKDSPFVFPIGETEKRLDAAAPDPSGRFGTQVQLGNPAMDTIGLFMMRLAPRTKTAPYKTTANNVYAAVKGSGTTTVDGQRFEWSRGDVVAAPAWLPHFHEANDDALLLRVTDAPVMERLGFYRVAESAPAAH